MCGLYGFYGNPTKQTSAIVERLGLLNQSRGSDSTGLAIVCEKNYFLYKKAIDARRFFIELEKTKKISFHKRDDKLIVMGHTRYATHGVVNDQNAHPFRIGRVLFTHNGVISNFWQLKLEYDVTYPVDSQIIGYLLNKNQTNQPGIFKELSGYYAVPFVNLDERDVLRVAISAQTFAYAIRGDQLYYSSDIRHLKLILKGKGFQIGEAGKDVLYTFFTVGKHITIGKQRIETQPYSVVKYETPNGAGHYDSFLRSYGEDKTKKTTTKLLGSGNVIVSKEGKNKTIYDQRNFTKLRTVS